MPLTFRCKCGGWIRTDAEAPVARCPKCLRTVGRPNISLLWWLFGSVAAVLALISIVASVLPRSSDTIAQAAEPTPRTLPTPTSPTAQRTQPTLPKPVPVTPPTQTPTVPENPTTPASPPAPAPVPEQPRVGKLQVEPAGKYKEGDTFVQEVTVVRTSAFGVLGIVTTQAAEYTLSSKLEVTKVNVDGCITVAHTVLSGKLLDASADLKDPLTDALKKAVGAKFELLIGPTGKVTALKGLDDPVNVKLGRDVEQQTLRLWSILDADAWKELAGLTFFQPDKPGLGEKWARDFTHDWGPLGSWLGRTDYLTAKQPEKNGQHKIDYVHAISHRPAKSANGLQFTIKEISFPAVTAGGAIRYDARTNRVSAAEELFHVRGAVSVSFGGADATVEVEERQKFRLTASEVKPREMIGQGPKR